MNDPEQTAHYHTPSRKSLLLSTAIAIIVATVILITIVLPVEYDIDPTGIGNLLGLTAISTANMESESATARITVAEVETGAESVVAASIEAYKTRDPGDPPHVSPGSDMYVKNVDTTFRSEIIEIPVQGDEELEYKFQMREGQMLLYSWSSGTTELYFEFHAEPTEGEYPEGYYMSYQIGDGSTGGHGTLVAPFTGNHGWYFLNLTEHPVTIKLEVSGYYDSHSRLW